MWDSFFDTLIRDDECLYYPYDNQYHLESLNYQKSIFHHTEKFTQRSNTLDVKNDAGLWNSSEIHDPYYNISENDQIEKQSHEQIPDYFESYLVNKDLKSVELTPEENITDFEEQKNLKDHFIKSHSPTPSICQSLDNIEENIEECFSLITSTNTLISSNRQPLQPNNSSSSSSSSSSSCTSSPYLKDKKTLEQIYYTSEEAKNVLRHYGRNCRKFALKKLGLKIALEYLQKPSLLKNFKKFILNKVPKINKIEQFRDALLVKCEDSKTTALMKKAFQYVSEQYVEFYSHNAVFNMKTMKKKDIHIMAKHKILRRIKNPELFTYMHMSTKDNKKTL